MKQSKIAITGGIGSGKSTVANLIREMGYIVLSADDEYKKVLKDQSVLEKINSAFGCVKDGKLDRKMLSQIVFGNEEKLTLLNSITHPAIMERIGKGMTDEISFAEIPLLFEGGFEHYFDHVIVVMREKEMRIRSVMERNKLTREEVISRMENQFDYDNADLSAHTLIWNDGSIELLRQKVVSAVQTLVGC